MLLLNSLFPLTPLAKCTASATMLDICFALKERHWLFSSSMRLFSYKYFHCFIVVTLPLIFDAAAA